MENRIPSELLHKLMIAVPEDRTRRPVAMATHNRAQFEEHLRQAGYDPAACAIGHGSLASAEFVVDWDRIEFIEFPAAT